MTRYFNMNHLNRGHALIINNITFQKPNLSYREGAENDHLSLKEVFENFEFNVRVEVDKTATEIEKLLEYFSCLDHSDNDCFMCIVMSHGKAKVVFGVDGKSVYLEERASALFNNIKCPTLSGKPKIFISGACQGDRRMKTISTLSTTTSFLNIQSNGFEHSKIGQQNTDPRNTGYTSHVEFENMSAICDFLFCYATLKKHVSYRSKTDGDIYFNELTKALREFGSQKPLENILKIANEKLTRYLATPNYAQTPFYSSQLANPKHV